MRTKITNTMPMKLAIVTNIIAAICLASSIHGAEADKIQTDGAKIGVWTMDLDAAKKLAAEKDLPIMLNFTGSDWCGWCQHMDKQVFAEQKWRDYAKENTLLVTIDFPKDKSIVPEKYGERNEELKKKFGVGGYPTYIVLDSDGETKIGELSAGRDKTPESFIAEFEDVARFGKTRIEDYIKKNPDKAEAYKSAIQDFKDANKALSDWIATRPPRNEKTIKEF